jgi:hypothetical protein
MSALRERFMAVQIAPIDFLADERLVSWWIHT